MRTLSSRLLTVADVTASVPPDHRRAAVAVVLHAARAGPEVLLMERVQDERDPWSGQVSLPGGHEEDGDPDLVATAVRETREELGIDLGSATLGGAFGPVRARVRGRLLQTTIVPVVFVPNRRPAVELGPEAAAAFWLPLRQAAAGELDGIHVLGGEGPRRELPCWNWEGRVVWGLTHLILGDLLSRAGRALT